MILEINAMFSFFKKKSPPPEAQSVPAPGVTPTAAPVPAPVTAPVVPAVHVPDVTRAAPVMPAATTSPEKNTAAAPAAMPASATAASAEVAPPAAAPAPAARQGWLDRLKAGLRKTGASITTVFTGTRIDDELYEELETALLVADTGVKATEHLLQDLKRRVKEAKATEPSQVKTLLADAITDLLQPLQKPLAIGNHQPTVIMVAGVNGAGKTTSIGKLTKHLADEGLSVLLAAADTFRAAAKEQLAVWATLSLIHI